jgi:hemerythrin
MPVSKAGIDEALWINQLYIQKIDIKERLEFLKDAISMGQGRAIVGQILFDLVDYSLERFNFEEDRYSRYLFPEEEEKNSAYQQFRQVIGNYYDCFNKGLSVSPFEIVDYLDTWLAVENLN